MIFSNYIKINIQFSIKIFALLFYQSIFAQFAPREIQWSDVFTQEVYQYYNNNYFNNEADYGTVLHIDPDYTGPSNNGTITNPFTSLSQAISVQSSDVAFLVKRGTTHDASGNLYINNAMIGAYGEPEGLWGEENRPDLGSGRITLRGGNILVRDIEVGSFRNDNINASNNSAFASRFYGTQNNSHLGVNYLFIGIEVLNNNGNGLFFQNWYEATNNIEIGYSYIHKVNQTWHPNGASQNVASGDGIQFNPLRGSYHIHNNIIDKSDVGNKFLIICNPGASQGEMVTGIIENNYLYNSHNYPDNSSGVYLEGLSGSTANAHHFVIIRNNIFIGKDHMGSNWSSRAIRTSNTRVEAYGNIMIDYNEGPTMFAPPHGQNHYHNNTLLDVKSSTMLVGTIENVYNNIFPTDNINASINNFANNVFVDEINTGDFFVNYTEEDFRLKQGSSGINGGAWESWMDSEWTEDLLGTPITQDNNIDIGALQFAEGLQPEPPYTLSVNITGDGTVIKNPEKAEYDQDEEVILTAIEDDGWLFTGWSGSLAGNTNPATLVMNSNKNVTATFEELESENQEYVRQSISGTGNVSFPLPLTAGNLLVAVLAHRHDPADSPTIPEGFTLREVVQHKTDNQDRHGVLIADKIADGTETSINLNFGTESDLGGIIIEFNVDDVHFYGANSNTSGNEIPSSFTESVPKPSVSHLSVSAAVSRNAGALTAWNNEFTSPLATINQIGIASRLDENSDKPGNVTVQNTGDQGAIIVATWSLGDPGQSYQINTSVTGNGSITLNPNKPQYYENESVQVTAVPDTGWEFVQWSGDLTGTTNPATVIMNSDKNITATFQLSSYQINAQANPVNGGQVAGAGTFNHGQTANLNATPASEYNFVNWTESGNIVSTSPQYSFTVVQNRNLVANFSLETYTVSLTSNPANGGQLTGGGTYESGEDVTINAQPNTGYSFVNWTENGNVISENPQFTFTISSNRNITAHFSLNTHVIQAISSPQEGGTVSGIGTFNYGTTATLVATPADDYHFTYWTENGNVVSHQQEYSFTVTEDRNLTAHFAMEILTVYLISQPEGAGILLGSGNYEPGNLVNIIAMAEPGYIFQQWTDEQGSVVSPEVLYSFIIDDDRTFTAHFIQETYTLTLSPNPTFGGIATGAGTNYTHGEEVTAGAIPNPGFQFSAWAENGTEVSTDAFYTFSIISDRSLVAQFSPQEYHIQVVISPEEGGSVNGAGWHLHGDYVSLDAFPSQDYVFLQWAEDGESVSYDVNYIFFAEGNRNLVAQFLHIDELVKIDADTWPQGFAFIEGAGDYPAEHLVQLKATPLDNDYNFIGWMENGQYIGYENPYNFTATHDRNITASFLYQPGELEIRAQLSLPESGYIYGAGNYSRGDIALLQAEVEPNVSFQGWRNIAGQIVSRQNPWSFEVNRDIELEAVVKLNSEFPDEESDKIIIYPNPSDGRINIVINENAYLTVYNSYGIIEEDRYITPERPAIDLSHLPMGIYLLRFETSDDGVQTKKIIIK